MTVESYSWTTNKVIKDDGSIVYACKGCGSEWSSPVSCGRHAGRCIEFIGEEKYKEFRTKLDSHKKPYVEPDHCYNEINYEDGSKTYACKWCGKEFSTPLSCRSHVINCKEYVGEERYNEKRIKISESGKSEETQRKRKQTFMDHYGVDNPMKSDEVKKTLQNTCLEKYGVNYALGSSVVREKIKQTTFEHYGVENPFASEEVKDSIKNTLMDHYGVDNPMKSDLIREKAGNTNLERYGSYNVFGSSEIKSKIMNTVMDRYGVQYYCLADNCIKANNAVISSYNKRMAKLFEEEGLSSDFEYRIENRSYDLIIDEYKLLVEVDPTHTHNSVRCFRGGFLEPNYHLMKTELANKYGFHCIHVFDWDWWEFIPKLYSKNKTRLYARNCKVKEINDYKIVSDFLYNYHIQGPLRHNKSDICIGLYHGEELVSVMLLGNPRYNKNYQYELLRLCTDYNYEIIGGNQKLFKYFIRNYNPESIISYCDRAKFQGKVYNKLGFNFIYDTDPTAHWYNYEKHYTDNLLRKLGADKLIGTNYGKGTDNEQIMIDHGYTKIYDCGQSVYEWRNPNEN